LKAVALADVDPTQGVGLAVQAARWSDRCASPFAIHSSVVALALLATRIGRLDVAQILFAHAEASDQWQANIGFRWMRAETHTALQHHAGVTMPIPPKALPRRELFAILTDLEAAS
jgi:hypothetical protein